MPDSTSPQQPQATAPAAAQPTAAPATETQPAKPSNPTSLEVAVKRTAALRKREEALAAKEAGLKSVEELSTLMKTDPAAAFERLAGDGFLEAYKAITNRVVGTQDEAAALAALPKSVRDRLAEVEDLKKRAALVEELTARLGALEDGKKKAEATLLDRQKQEAASRVFSTGFQAVEKAAAELPLLMGHPKRSERLQARWVGMMGEKKTELAALKPEQRQQRAAELVLEAARAEQKALEEETGWVLQTPWARGKILGKAPKAASAPSTSASIPATPKPPRTGTPTSLGGPSAPDLRKMTLDERMRHLKARERAGTLFTKT